VEVANMPSKMPIKYELRCKEIPKKYLDREGCVYGIYWVNKANRTFDVLYIKYLQGMEHTEDNIQVVVIAGYIVAVKPTQECPADIRKEMAILAKYTELWAVYPNYKRRVW
jgi:hypothetical protein